MENMCSLSESRTHRGSARGCRCQGRPFDPHDFTGVWDSAPTNKPVHPGGVLLDFTTLPPLTPYGKELWDATQAVQIHKEIPPMNGGEGSKDPMLHCDPLGFP